MTQLVLGPIKLSCATLEQNVTSPYSTLIFDPRSETVNWKILGQFSLLQNHLSIIRIDYSEKSHERLFDDIEYVFQSFYSILSDTYLQVLALGSTQGIIYMFANRHAKSYILWIKW